MSKLNNITLGFGETKDSPTRLSDAQINTLVKVIEDESVETKRMSGFITSDNGIKGSVAWLLGRYGVTYVGKILADGYTISADKSEVSEGESVNFIISGVPAGALSFEVQSISVQSGDVDADYIKSIISFEEGKMVIGEGVNVNGWTANVNILVKPKYESTETYMLTVKVKCGIVPSDFTLTNALNYKAIGTSEVNLVITPSNYTIPIKSVVAELANASENVSVDAYGRTIQVNVTKIPSATENNTLRVTLTPQRGNAVVKEFPLSVISIPVTSIKVMSGGSEVSALSFNSVSEKVLTFQYLPTDANLPIKQMSGVYETPTTQFALSSVTLDGVTAKCVGIGTLERNKIVFTATDVLGNEIVKKVDVDNKIEPTLSLSGADSFKATNGYGSADYTFGYSPTVYNAVVELISVTSSNSVIKVTNATKNGFTLSVSGTSADQSGTITAKVRVDGIEKTLTKNVTAKWEEMRDANGHDFVDLGLPSGLLWATCNVGATQPHEKGLFFQWGSVNGHAEGSGYNFAADNYPKSGISADLSLSQDGANANMGGTWRMPTRLEFQELDSNTTNVWTSQGGINGELFTSKTNGNSIFFPAAGLYNGTSLNDVGSIGTSWSRSFNDSSYAYNLYFYSSRVYPQDYSRRYFGLPIRAVL